ncbi:MAG: energy transducer TonB [Nonlabens sp.]
MNHLNDGQDAATSSPLERYERKKSTNTRASSILNFQLGLIIVLLISYLAIELTSQVQKQRPDLPVNTYTLSEDENMGKFTLEKKIPKPAPKPLVKKPQPKIAHVKKVTIDMPPVISDKEVEPQVTAPKKVDTTVPVKVTSSSSIGLTGDKTISNSGNNLVNTVMEVPLFPGCKERLNREERIECLNKKMTRFVQRKFDTRSAVDFDAGERVRITVLFTIGIDGLPRDIQVMAPNKQLEREALKVVSGLPRMIPGKNNGVAVNVTYVLPIIFQVNNR